MVVTDCWPPLELHKISKLYVDLRFRLTLITMKKCSRRCSTKGNAGHVLPHEPERRILYSLHKMLISFFFCSGWLIIFSGLVGSVQAADHGFTSPIKTIVVLVMENRSFDHILGFMKKDNSDIDGLTGNESNPKNLTDPNSGQVFVNKNAMYVAAGDPGHSFQAMTTQIFGLNNETSTPIPPMNGFASQAESMKPGFSATVMSMFKPEEVSVYRSLTQEFAVFDKWFASVPSSTQPNRLYVHSATSHGLMSNNETTLSQGLPQKTIFELVQEAGLTFGIYYQQIPATLFFRNLRQPKYAPNFIPYDLLFKSHAKLGKLPNYSVIEQRYFDVVGSPANDDHPAHDVAEGQRFVKEIYEALRSSPQWNQTLFLITYDEHGGFFDHVPTPTSGVPNPDGLNGSAPPYTFDFTRLGVRVPTMAISPWIEAGTVVHGATGPTSTSQYEHSSIPATVSKLFHLTKAPLTSRDKWAGTFEGVLTRTTPRTDCPVTLPAPPTTLRATAINQFAALSEFQEEMIVLASTLKGDHDIPMSPAPQVVTNTMKVIDGYHYVTEAVNAYFANTGRT